MHIPYEVKNKKKSLSKMGFLVVSDVTYRGKLTPHIYHLRYNIIPHIYVGNMTTSLVILRLVPNFFLHILHLKIYFKASA